MAVLADADRKLVWGDLMRSETAQVALTKVQFRAAVDACDDWIDQNAASFNNALPTAAKNNLTAKQKQRLFMAVARRRWEI